MNIEFDIWHLLIGALKNTFDKEFSMGGNFEGVISESELNSVENL